MIGTIIKLAWLNLKRDYIALGLIFVLPIVFFSIFAVIFGGMSGGDGNGMSALDIIVADADDTTVSRRLAEAIGQQDALNVVSRGVDADSGQTRDEPYTRDEASSAVRAGEVDAAVVIPAGFSEHFGNFVEPGEAIEVIYDAANPIAQHTVTGLLQAAAMQAAPDVLMEQGLGWLESAGEDLTPKQQQAVDSFLPFLRGEQPWEDLVEDGEEDEPATGGDADASETVAADGGEGFNGFLQVKATDARAGGQGEDDQGSPSIVAYYAAGIGVMFLLFSMAGAGGSLLDEEERGTLERLLTSNVGMGTLLIGNWIFFAVIGVVQLAIMFIWGAVVFGLDLWSPRHLSGFLVMTLFTAAAGAAFGIVLATICRSRAQLSGISTIVILIMSALGGSMVPRFIMPAFMETTSKFTFNGWALDGYLKVFWYDDPQASLLQAIAGLLPQLAVLAGLTAVFLLLARVLARRWETA